MQHGVQWRIYIVGKFWLNNRLALPPQPSPHLLGWHPTSGKSWIYRFSQTQAAAPRTRTRIIAIKGERVATATTLTLILYIDTHILKQTAALGDE